MQKSEALDPKDVFKGVISFFKERHITSKYTLHVNKLVKYIISLYC